MTSVSAQLLESLGRCEGYSSLFSFSHLKKFNLENVTGFRYGLGSGCRCNFLQHMTTLEALKIDNFHALTELPESLGSLHSLQKLTIDSCDMSSLPKISGPPHIPPVSAYVKLLCYSRAAQVSWGTLFSAAVDHLVMQQPE